MKNRFLYICLSLFLGSCTFASFTERPGVLVKEYPKDIYGTYINIDKSNGVRDTHILKVDANGAHIDDPIFAGFSNLNDSVNSLSHLGDFFYLNVSKIDSTGKTYWFVYPFEYDSKNIYIYKLVLTKKSIKKMRKSGLKPTGKYLGQYYMDNNAFKKYCERYLKKKDAIKFTRIK